MSFERDEISEGTRVASTEQLQHDAAGLLFHVVSDKNPVVIVAGGNPAMNRRGKIVAVMIPGDEYEAFVSFRKAVKSINALGN